MHHQAGVHFENFTDVKFRDILLTRTGHWNRRLNRGSPSQTGMYGRSTYELHIDIHLQIFALLTRVCNY